LGNIARRISGALLALIGMVLLGGGAYLAWLGGTLYYLIAGAAILVSGVFYWQGVRWGERLYALMLIGTLAWACVESGANPWALTARLFTPAVLGLWLAMPWIRRDLRDIDNAAPWRSEAGIAAIIIIALLAFRFMQFENAASVDAPPSPIAANQSPTQSEADWPSYGNGLEGRHFAPLAQINTQNVARLQVAWVYHSGNGTKSNVAEATPIKVGDTLYACDTHTTVYAIDAKTGKEKWRNDPNVDISKFVLATCRGVAFYHVPNVTGACSDRVIATGPGGILRALDAATGASCADFGANGVVDLLKDLGKVDAGVYTLNSAPTVVAGMIILGAYVADNFDADIASGVIRAYDAKSGVLRWAWDMGAPDRVGPPPAGRSLHPQYAERLAYVCRRRGAGARLRSHRQSEPRFLRHSQAALR
jgi:quinoprotein glucose dehydrogenase